MGMRIHKIIGYGIHGKTHGIDQHAFSERLYENAVDGEVAALIDPEIEKARAENREGYVTLSFHGTVWANRLDKPNKYPKHFSDIVHYAEFPDSDDGWWVIMPPADFKQWFRWDNSIDWVEASLSDQMETVVKEVGAPLYPYLNWMNKDTGEIIRDITTMRDGIPRDRDTMEPIDAVPYVPEVIGIIAKHLEMPDRKLFRPVLIQWWS